MLNLKVQFDHDLYYVISKSAKAVQVHIPTGINTINKTEMRYKNLMCFMIM